jgi:signal transduction histidine kinase
VLLNLVSNALEAVDSGGEVSLEFSDTDGGDLCIEISDDRAGTDVDALRRLMSVTEDRWPGETRGWTRGLGLTISTRLVEAAGGRIDVMTISTRLVEAAGGRIDVMSRGAGGSTIFRVDLPFPPL